MAKKVILKISRAHKFKIYMLSRAHNALCALIKFYQVFISPGLGYNCRFYPSCSRYTAEMIQKYGTIKGLKKGIWRISRCHPFNKGGVDLP